MRVTVVDYGRSNLLSVCRALAALGAQPQLAQTPEQVRRAGALVLPEGVKVADVEVPLRNIGVFLK